jgi:hypothetical protein
MTGIHTKNPDCAHEWEWDDDAAHPLQWCKKCGGYLDEDEAMETKADTRAYGPADFGNFKTGKREVKVEERYESATVRLSQDDTARMIENAIRAQYNINYDYKITITFLNPDRTEDAVDVVVERKLP